MSLIDTLYDTPKVTDESLTQYLAEQATVAAQNGSGTSSGPQATTSTQDTMILSPQAIVAAAPYISENHTEKLSSTLTDGTIATVAKRTDTAKGQPASYTVNITEQSTGAGFSLDFTGDVSIGKNSDGGYSIYHSESDTTHMLGTDGSRSQVAGNAIDANADTLHVSTSGSAVTTGNGNNTVFVYGDNATITGGSGNDTVVLNSGLSNVTVNTGNGNDTVTSGGVLTDSNIDLGEGNNTLSVTNLNGGSVSAGDGNNIVSVYSAKDEASITLGDGANKTTVNSLTDNSSLSIGNGHGLTYLGAMEGTASASFGTGDNTVHIGTAAGESSISLGNGNNTVLVSHLKDETSLTFGDGNNKITGSGTAIGGNSFVVLGDGNNDITLGLAEGGSLKAGNGNNYMHVGSIGDNTSVSAGNGNNKVMAGEVNGSASMTFGHGNNSITTSDISGDSNITTGGGYNQLVAGNVSGDASISLGNNVDSWASITSFSGGASLTVGGKTYNKDNPYRSGSITIDVGSAAGDLYNKYMSTIISNGTTSEYTNTVDREKALAAYTQTTETNSFASSSTPSSSEVESSGDASA